MAIGGTNTNMRVITKLNEVISNQSTIKSKVNEVDTTLDTSLPSISTSLQSIDSKTSQLNTLVNQVKNNTQQIAVKQYIPNTGMKYCGLHTRLAAWLSEDYWLTTPTGAVLNGELHVVSDSYHIKWNASGWSVLSNKSAYGYYYVGYSCMVVYNNELHLMGGANSTTGYNHYKWNGSSWVNTSTLPFWFDRAQAVVYNNEIHILGSYVGSYGCYHYKWNGSAWTSVSTIPVPFCEGSAVVYNDEIHLLGNGATNSKGASYNKSSHYKWSYNFGWREESDIPIDFYRGGAVVLNNEIYIVGGYAYADIGTTTNYKIYSWSGHEWSYVADCPYTFNDGLMIAYDGVIHLIGGSGSKNSHYQLRPVYSTTMYLKENTFVTGSQLSVKRTNDPYYLIRYGSSYRIQNDGVYDITASSGIMLS